MQLLPTCWVRITRMCISPLLAFKTVFRRCIIEFLPIDHAWMVKSNQNETVSHNGNNGRRAGGRTTKQSKAHKDKAALRMRSAVNPILHTYPYLCACKCMWHYIFEALLQKGGCTKWRSSVHKLICNNSAPSKTPMTTIYIFFSYSWLSHTRPTNCLCRLTRIIK